MEKKYRYRQNIGRAQHAVSYHDGAKTHGDGSPFFDLRVFSRSRDAKAFIRALVAAGYAAA